MPSQTRLLPTLSLYSASAKVIAHFSMQDMEYVPVLPSGQHPDGLDGAPLFDVQKRKASTVMHVTGPNIPLTLGSPLSMSP